MKRMNKTWAKKYSRVLKIFSSKTRLQVLSMLDTKVGKSVEDISTDVNMAHSAVSHQLAVLLKTEMVRCKKDGRHMMYRITPRADRVMRAIDRF